VRVICCERVTLISVAVSCMNASAFKLIIVYSFRDGHFRTCYNDLKCVVKAVILSWLRIIAIGTALTITLRDVFFIAH